MMILKYVALVILMILFFPVFAVIFSLAVIINRPYPSSEDPPLWLITGAYVFLCLTLIWKLEKMSVITMILKYVALVILMVLVFPVFVVIFSMAVIFDSPSSDPEIPPLWITTGLYVCICLVLLVPIINKDLEVLKTKAADQ